MVNIFLVIVLACVSIAHFANGNCGPCPHTLRHYHEFDCKGIHVNHGDCCPTKYLCPDLTELDPDKCHYKTKTYAIGEKISESERPLCFKSCTCARNNTENGTEVGFKCDVIPKVPWDGDDHNCLRQYKPNVCSHVNRVCGDENIDKLYKCFWRGKNFYEGERFTTDSDPCYSCHCDRNFDNSISISDNTLSCSKKNCGLALQYFNKFRWGCVPVYNRIDACCPTDEWICPPTKRIKTARKDMTCRFGEEKIKYWGTLATSSSCLKCQCVTPPDLTCIRMPNCNILG